MRVKRAKQYKKLMNQYQLGFGFRPPYQILLDADFIKTAQQNKMRLGSMLESVLQGEIKPMITQCCIRHLYDAEADNAGQKAQKDAWIEVAKQAERRRCGHHELEEPLSTLECLESVVDPKGSGTNKHRYAVASQDPEVRARMREIAGVPLVYINRSVMILEPMAAKSEQVREADEKGKIRAGLKGGRGAGAGGAKRKRDDEGLNDEEMPARARAIAEAEANGSQSEPTAKKRKVKGPKGPNPLSVKKAKKDAPKSAAREVEDERASIRKAAKKDPQAADKAVDAHEAAGEGGGGVTEGPRKRRRRRKPREGALNGADDVDGVEAVADD